LTSRPASTSPPSCSATPIRRWRSSTTSAATSRWTRWPPNSSMRPSPRTAHMS